MANITRFFTRFSRPQTPMLNTKSAVKRVGGEAYQWSKERPLILVL